MAGSGWDTAGTGWGREREKKALEGPARISVGLILKLSDNQLTDTGERDSLTPQKCSQGGYRG